MKRQYSLQIWQLTFRQLSYIEAMATMTVTKELAPFQCRISQWATVGKCPGPVESRARRGQIYEKNLTANFYKYVKL